MRTQRASSPQMLALVAQLVSLGSVGTESGSPLLIHWGLGSGSWLLPREALHSLTNAAVFLIGPVPTVIEHVAAQGGREAALVPAQKLLLVLAVGSLGRRGLWGGEEPQVLGIHSCSSSHRVPLLTIIDIGGSPKLAGEAVKL